jgi:hypothetical protein
MRKPSLILGVCVLAAASVTAACGGGEEEVDCVPAEKPAPKPEKKAKVVKRVLNPQAMANPDGNWCRACVMGPRGYASCQKVYEQNSDEELASIRRRARTKACLDAGFKDDSSCPDAAIIGLTCKGDPPPPNATDPSTALQQLFYGKKGPPADGSGKSPVEPAAEADPAAGAPPKSAPQKKPSDTSMAPI